MSQGVLILRLWFVTSRPVLYPLVPIIILFGYQASGGTLTTLTLSEFLILALYTLPFSLIVYGLNDIYDYQSDVRNVKRHWLTGDTAIPQVHYQILMGVMFACGLLLFTTILLGNLLLVIVVASTVLFAYIYSVPPVRLKARPVVDSLISGTGYIILPFCIGTALNNQLLLLPEVIIVTLFVCAYHVLCSIRDYEADAAVGDVTTAVFFGVKNTTILVIIISAITTVWWWLIHPQDYFGIGFFLSLGIAAFVTLQRPSSIQYAVNVMVLIAAFVAIEKLFW